METEINYKIKITDVIDKLTTKEMIELANYLLDYDKVKEVVEDSLIENSVYVDDLKDQIRHYKSEIQKFENEKREYSFNLLIAPSELKEIQKFKTKNDIHLRIDNTYSNKYFVECKSSKIQTLLNFGKQIDFLFMEDKPTDLNPIERIY